MKKMFLKATIVLALLLVSCSPEIIDKNPAADDCKANGGNVEIRNENGEQIGYCVFPDGSECSQSEYDQGMCDYQSQNQEAIEESSVGLANPASAYCEEQGGLLEIRTDEEGNQFGVCVFPNGNECEEWSLFNGMCDPETGHTITAPSEEAHLGIAYIKSTELKMKDTLVVFIQGELPDPCHQLYIQSEEPGTNNIININAGSWYLDSEFSCAQVITPFEFNFKIPTENLKEGTYTVMVNGEEVGAFNYSE